MFLPLLFYANWYCGPVIKLKRWITNHGNFQIAILDHKCPVPVSDQAKILPAET